MVSAIFPLFFVILLGFFVKRIRLINDEFIRPANRLIFYIAIPSLLFIKISQSPFHKAFKARLILSVLLPIVLGWLLGLIVLNFLNLERKKKGSFLQISSHGNIGYIGLAVSYYVFGEKGLLLACALAGFIMILQNLLSVFSLSIFGIKKNILKIVLGLFSNPIIVSSIVGLLFSYFNLKIPYLIRRFMEIISSMALPMGLTIIGANLSLNMKGENMKLIGIASFIKMILIPAFAYMFLKSANGSFFEVGVALSILAAPCATISTIMAIEMGGDPSLASQAISFMTIFSSLTYMFWLSFVNHPIV